MLEYYEPVIGVTGALAAHREAVAKDAAERAVRKAEEEDAAAKGGSGGPAGGDGEGAPHTPPGMELVAEGVFIGSEEEEEVEEEEGDKGKGSGKGLVEEDLGEEGLDREVEEPVERPLKPRKAQRVE